MQTGFLHLSVGNSWYVRFLVLFFEQDEKQNRYFEANHNLAYEFMFIYPNF